VPTTEDHRIITSVCSARQYEDPVVSESLVLGLGVALSPLPILAILLFLGGSRPKANATAFCLAWIGGVASATIVAVLAVERSNVTDSEPVWLAVAELVVGAAFLVLASYIAFDRGRPAAASPAWQAALDRAGPFQAAALAFFLSCANPKNLALILGAAVLMVDVTSGNSELAVSTGAFVAVAVAGVSLPVAVYGVFPDRVGPRLGDLRRALVRRGLVLAIVLGFAIGTLFVTEGIRGL
jgi:Sap, sulfolipid-1-addressing protein